MILMLAIRGQSVRVIGAWMRHEAFPLGEVRAMSSLVFFLGINFSDVSGPRLDENFHENQSLSRWISGDA